MKDESTERTEGDESLALRVADGIVSHSKLVILVLLVATAIVGSAAGQVEMSTSTDSFQTETVAADKLDYVNANFGDPDAANRTTVQVVVRNDNVLTRESLLEILAFQRSLAENDSVAATLAAEPSTVSVANVVAIAAVQQDRAAAGRPGGPPPNLTRQIGALESRNAAEVERLVERALSPDADAPTGGQDPLTLLPTHYEPGTASTNATVVVAFQDTGGSDGISEPVSSAQLDMQALAADRFGDDAFVFGVGIVEDETGRSIGDSFAIIGPVALLLVILTLVVAYRDLVDIVLSTLGIGLVLVWMQGFMGWFDIPFGTTLIAVPILLIGLAIDYAIHVFMRHREVRDGTPEPGARDGMVLALGSVGIALVWVTVTTSIGFLSNLVSPLAPLQNFGLVSAAGIVSTLVVFGALIPALKVEVDTLLERVGLNRRKTPFGGDTPVVGRLLSLGAVGAKRAPAVVLVVAVLLSGVGAYGGTQVDTSFDRSDFLTEQPPDWMEELPEPFAPGEYNIRQNAAFLNDNFLQQRDTSRAELLIEGRVTDPGTLDRVVAVRDRAVAGETVITLADDEPRILDPVSTIQAVAAQNETFAATVAAADTDDDGVPDQNLTAVYDGLYRTAPAQARQVVARNSAGEYEALRVQVAIQGGSSVPQVRDEMQAAVEPAQGDGLTATATGQPVLTAIVQDGLLETVVLTLVVTVLAVLAVLVVGYRLFDGYASLGAVTIVPVVLSLAWVLGVMYLLEIPFNAQTALITSLGIGLGVDYSIHMSERFTDELERLGDVDDALTATIDGTGGALLGSAVTTAAGFSTLALAIVPSLQRFGIVIGVAIVFAFVGAVLVLPSILALWGRSVPN
ncbi:efflux RND transporter permease subunit [Haloarchaeobius iranensis]|uniref:Predicted exporter protein, RND superfamily n=1 Tax=Haloarchaeobius iranensis TaxID=996166 RepID=A0A1G9WQU6_9EURY|nr:MMPL family transporter [Haloarchaeobius iranensis]SDM86563.1 Predicted exporter protein, RND superfamily [Haloarchaeobius iranensis]